MIIQSKQNRTFIMSAILESVPDVIIAAIVTALMDEGFLLFIVVIVGLQVVYLAIWIKTSLWAWAMYKLRGKKIMVQTYVDFFTANNFPQPSEYLSDGEEYLVEVVENESLDVETRLKAAFEAGSLVAIRGFSRFQQLLRVTFAYEEAIEEYNRLCLSKKESLVSGRDEE